jgi:methylated-DNA-protein-cysteine methyltransferase-like protein
MASVPVGTDVPWHRVINSRGGVSLKGDGYEMQMALLRSEGVEFGAAGHVDLSEFGWTGPGLSVDGDTEGPVDGLEPR